MIRSSYQTLNGILLIYFISCDNGNNEHFINLPDPPPIQESFKITDFESAETCKQCHPNHYNEWSGSMHAYALKDPVWFALHSKEQTHFQENENLDLSQFCIMCHSPIAFLTNAIPDPASLTFESSSELSSQIREGITCSSCHAVTYASPATNVNSNEGTLDAIEYFFHTDTVNHIKYGPIEDPIASSYHQSEFNPLYRESEYCMGCHNLTIDGIGAEMTFDEWSGTAYQAMGFECQTCHMQSYLGYAVDTMIVQGAPFRNNLHRHNFAGIDQALTPFVGEDAQAEAIYQLLSTAADIAIVSEVPQYVYESDTLLVQVGITNNAGHNLPTGVTFSRQLWLEVLVNSGENTFYRSGHLNDNKDLYDFYIDPLEEEDPDLIIFNTVLYDAEGDSGLRNVSVERMAYMSDYTIPTNGSKIVTYEIPIPENMSNSINFSARLRFRALPPFFLHELVPGADETKLTIFDIDSTSIVIPVMQSN